MVVIFGLKSVQWKIVTRFLWSTCLCMNIVDGEIFDFKPKPQKVITKPTTWWSDVRCTVVDQKNLVTIFHCTDFKPKPSNQITNYVGHFMQNQKSSWWKYVHKRSSCKIIRWKYVQKLRLCNECKIKILYNQFNERLVTMLITKKGCTRWFDQLRFCLPLCIL